MLGARAWGLFPMLYWSGYGSHTLGCTAWLQCVPGCTVDLVALWAKSKTIDTYIYSLWPNHPKS